jgi:hypothetical protein
MSKDSIFTDEWRKCLRAHYMDVVRRDDQRTLKTLVRVMHDTGFSDDELAELRVRATMRAEDMPEDFVPDTHLFQVNADFPVSEDVVPAAEPLIEPAYVEQEISNELLQPLDEVAEVAQETVPEELEEIDSEKEDPDAPQQLSLF